MRDYLSDIMMITYPYIYLNCDTIKNKGENVIYVNSLNDIYAIIREAILIYKNFVCDTTTILFELNHYQPCVPKKLVNGKQLTVV